MFSEEKSCPKQGRKKPDKVLIKPFHSNTSYGFEYKKCISKLPIKIFIKRKTRARKA